MNIIERLILRVFPGLREQQGSDVWIGPTVRASDVLSGRTVGSGQGAVFYGRATQYVLICAMLNAQNCTAVPLRLMRRKRVTVSGPVFKARARHKRMAHYRNAASVGRKAAEYAAYGDDVEEVTDHPVLDLRARPNPFMTGGDLDYLTFIAQELSGNAYEYVEGEGQPVELYPLGAQYTRAMPSETGFITGYYYARDQSDPVILPRESVLHYKHAPSPFDPFYGVGPLQAVLLEADLVQSATLAEIHSWKNLRRPDYVIEALNATPKQREDIKATVAREVQGLHKRGTPMVLSNAKITTLGFSPKDMEYLNGSKISNEMIWNAFGVPQSLLSLNDANLASSMTGHAQYARQTVVPRLCRRAEYLTEYLLPRYGIDPGEMWFAPDNPLPEDDSQDVDRVVKMLSGTLPIITQNEGRAMLGLEPIADEAADVLGGAKPAPPSNPFGGGPASPFADLLNPFSKGLNNGSVKDSEAGRLPPGRPAPGSEPVVDLGREGGRVVGGHGKGGEGTPGSGGRQVSVESFKRCDWYGAEWGRHAVDAKAMTPSPEGASNVQREFEGALRDWFKDAMTQFVNFAPDGSMMVSASSVQELSSRLDAIAREYIAQVSGIGFERAGQSLDLGFDVRPDMAIRYLDNYVPKLVDAVTTDLAVAVRDAVRSGLEAGSTIPEITSAVQEAIPGIADWKAERIARTESTHAYARGKMDAWHQAGVTEKQWLLSGNPCELCLAVAEAHPGPIPMDQPFFEDDWFGGMSEPRHPQCACDTVAVQVVEDQE